MLRRVPARPCGRGRDMSACATNERNARLMLEVRVLRKPAKEKGKAPLPAAAKTGVWVTEQLSLCPEDSSVPSRRMR